MIKHYTIEGLTWDLLTDFGKFISDIESDSFLNLYIHSEGGYQDVKDTIVEMIKHFEHKLYVFCAESAAFEMLAELPGPMVIGHAAYGMYHAGKMSIPFRDGLRKSSRTVLMEYQSQEEFKRTADVMYQLNFTDEERNSVLEGKDTYFNRTRMEEMFHNRLEKNK